MDEKNQIETELQLQLKNVLLDFPEYWEENTLLRDRVIEDIRLYKEPIIKRLVSNDLIADTYSLSVGERTVFKVEDFVTMLRSKNYWENSFTKYTNEIGLASEDKYLKYNTDVILDFPHKDCVLEGGMTKEEMGKKEVYYHNVLAKEEIDTLLSPKVLTNIKKFDENGEHSVAEFKDTDNLILKGNNLTALHALKERYAGKVKLIYIDPPYNTGGDSFKYNDRFNHSTWLTFMKNRIVAAKDLLANDGSLWINIDDDEAHYLKVLCDEVFGRSNFISNVVWEKKFSPQNDATWLSDSHDHILVFAKNKEIWRPNPLPRNAKMDSRYKNPDNDPRGPWTSGDLSVKTYSQNTDYIITTPSGREVSPPSSYCWRVTKEKLEEMIKDNRIWFGADGNNVPRIKRFLTDVKDGVTAMTIWKHTEVGHNQDAKKELDALENTESFSTPKPENLLNRIIHLGSNKDDIVLDFFMGSSTTQAVAHKMNRQYIGIEQMDYINTVSVPRLQKVIEGEQGGISKEVEWKGSGSFVYAELHSLNAVYVGDIQSASNEDTLNEVLTKMKDTAYLNFKVDISRVTSEDKGYQSLSLEEKKKVLMETLDMNQLYLNYSEIEDTQHTISDEVKQFNHSFYQKEGEQGE